MIYSRYTYLVQRIPFDPHEEESTKNRVALASELGFLHSFGLLASACSSCLVQLKRQL